MYAKLAAYFQNRKAELGLSWFERRIELNQRIGREETAFHLFVDQPIYAFVTDSEKATDIVTIVTDDWD